MILRYVVFERTVGTKSWRIAVKKSIDKGDGAGDFHLPAVFRRFNSARKFVKEVQSKRRGWWDGKPNQRPMESKIVKCVLPS